MIFQALVGAGLTGTGDPNDPITAALARIRQLGAHEVGHALGLAHNFAARTQGRYSVMDYPGPRVRLDATERPDRCATPTGLASGRGTNSWSTGSTAPAPTPRRAAWRPGAGQGLRFVADNDARPADAPVSRSVSCGTKAPIRSPSLGG